MWCSQGTKLTKEKPPQDLHVGTISKEQMLPYVYIIAKGGAAVL